MTRRYLLVTDATAGQVERAVGLRGLDTPHGALVEEPQRLDVGAMVAAFERARSGPRRCFCAVVHMPPCPFYAQAVT